MKKKMELTNGGNITVLCSLSGLSVAASVHSMWAGSNAIIACLESELERPVVLKQRLVE